MKISYSDLAVIYTCLIGIIAVLFVVANWRIESRNKKEQENSNEWKSCINRASVGLNPSSCAL